MNHSQWGSNPFPGTTRTSLIRRVCEGEEKAWFEFYDKYAAMICKAGLKINLSAAECDDLMVDVMMIFWRKMDSFLYDSHKGKFRNFLRRIAFFAALKRRGRSNGLSEMDDLTDYPDEVDSSMMDEWREFILNEALEELKAGVDSEVYQVFYMSFVQRRPVKDICRITRKTANSVYVIRSRCLKKLRRIISSYRELEENELRRRSNKNAFE